MTLSVIYFAAVAVINGAQAFKPSNVRMHATTRNTCNPDVKDQDGNPAPCGVSMAMETYGLILPGYEGGSVTTKEDLIIANDGLVKVQAVPSRPFQYLMQVEGTAQKRVDLLYKNQAFTVVEGSQDDSHLGSSGAPADLAADGWTHQGVSSLGGVNVNKYVKMGPQGVDAATGANYTALYQTGMYPDQWTLYTDEADEIMVKLIGTNSLKGGKVLQETDFENHEALDEQMTVDMATTEMHSTYEISGGRRLVSESQGAAPPVNPAYLTATFVGEAERVFFENSDDHDWMSKRRLRSLSGNKGIGYFDIPTGSAADTFFHAKSQRELVQLVKFQFPKSCEDDKGKRKQNYCLFVSADATTTSFSLKAGMTFQDVNDPTKTAHLSISVSIAKADGAPVLDLAIEAGGSVVVWQYGEGFSLNIVVAISGSASGQNLLQSDRSFMGELSVSVAFNVNVPVVGSIINWTINAKVACIAKPNNDIHVYGSIGTSISLGVAGAGVSIDITGNTIDNTANTWEFFSGVNFNAWVNVVVYKHSWNHRWEIWHASPVVF